MKMDELLQVLRERDSENKKDGLIWLFAIIGVITAVAGIAFGVYKFMTREDEDDFDDYDDDLDDFFEDDLEDEEDQENTEEEKAEEPEEETIEETAEETEEEEAAEENE